MKFAMYGSGAAGSVFASYLRKGGADIILIDRYEAHMKKVAEEGMTFTIHLQEGGEYRDITEVLQGFRTYTSAEAAAEAEGKVDVIIYMTKATQLEAAIQDLNIINTHDEQYNLTLYLKDGGIVSAENQRLDLFSRDTKCVYMRDMKGRYAVEVEFDISESIYDPSRNSTVLPGEAIICLLYTSPSPRD